MAVVAFKSHQSQLRVAIKHLKANFDDPRVLQQMKPVLSRAVALDSPNPADQMWRGEAAHWLGLVNWALDDLSEAKRSLELALEIFAPHEVLARARAKRELALLIAQTVDPHQGLELAKTALALHDDDLNNEKGHRQRRITESYVWRTRLLVNKKDRRARESFIDFALADCRDCSLRDQQQAIEFVLEYVKSGARRAQLDARLIEINARRRKPSGTVKSMAKLVIDINLAVVRRTVGGTVRKVIRKG